MLPSALQFYLFDCISQEYEVTVGNEDGTDKRFRMLFVNGTGTMVSPSEAGLRVNRVYGIISIVGVVPSASSSDMINDDTLPVLPYAFNFYEVAKYYSIEWFSVFTDAPSFSTLQVATAHLIESDPLSAFIVLVFDKEVKGSYEFVVEEEGEDVTLTINAESSSKSGATKEFKVIGDGKLLTHDTTYTIKSIVRIPEEDSPFVRMNETITFHIPKSPIGPSEEPEPSDPTDPEEPTEPEPDDPKDKKALSPEMKSLMSWLIPLVACLLIALVVVVVILQVNRKKRKNAELALKEMEVQEPLEVEKVEEFGVDCSDRVIRTDGNEHSAFHSQQEDSSGNIETNQQKKSGEAEIEWVEVMACHGDFAISAVPMTNTLYSMLHKEHKEIGKRVMGMQIVNGLKHVVSDRGWSDVLTRMSSHWILIDGSGNVQLKLSMTSEEAKQEAAQTHTNAQRDPNLEGNGKEGGEMREDRHSDKSGMDGLRWRAPEVVMAGGRNGEKSVDGSKASVFSLGLVLWEMETGQVPFGELDAVNAQRQSGTGIGGRQYLIKHSI
ncbi:hypothetical protein BLNAU_17222 [Blattamonas nauphoetae]|uniref:Protein kinase domain-containing protein n=1 Tax=Blattamonas nauphoetae TaxID=2049346 RepID=A0ABQ9XAY7_9EUKA|nr:hypothetical protein BLNAU_17222 [Blattamonas nauphoetae]